MAYMFDKLNPEDEVSIFWIPDKFGKIDIVKAYIRTIFVRPDGILIAEFCPLGLVNFPVRH
jgi:hypothetical protein